MTQQIIMTHDSVKIQTLVSQLVKTSVCLKHCLTSDRLEGVIFSHAVDALERLTFEYVESSQFQLGQRVRDTRYNERFGTVIGLMGTHYEEDSLEVWFDDRDRLETISKVYLQALPENDLNRKPKSPLTKEGMFIFIRY
ncbi:MAG: hypothetical protein J7647_00735 [Cyanobacteria bacterium SBLK]|nr:hypothetical protein [Cyanobacteria bacterium SBLK]